MGFYSKSLNCLTKQYSKVNVSLSSLVIKLDLFTLSACNEIHVNMLCKLKGDINVGYYYYYAYSTKT